MQLLWLICIFSFNTVNSSALDEFWRRQISSDLSYTGLSEGFFQEFRSHSVAIRVAQPIQNETDPFLKKTDSFYLKIVKIAVIKSGFDQSVAPKN